MINVFIADDHPSVIDGIKMYLKDEEKIQVVDTALNGRETLEKLKTLSIDVLLLDYDMPEINGLEVCKEVTQTYDNVKIIVISSYSEPKIVKSFIENGASGYLLKSSSKNEYIEAINDVFYLNGKSFSSSIKRILIEKNEPKFIPTRNELEVLNLLKEGYSNKEIAEKLCRSIHAIEDRRKRMLMRFNELESDHSKVLNTYSLLYYVIKHGFIN